MSLVIQGMHMPGCCGGCHKMGLAKTIKCELGNEEDWTNRLPNECPLTEIPDNHDDLIDVRELIQDLNYESFRNPFFRSSAEGVTSSVVRRQRVVLRKGC